MVQEATQFCIGLENEKGALARLCAVLREGGANIEALFVSNDEDGIWVNMVATPAEAAYRSLRESGYHFVPEKVLLVDTKSRPGGLERIAAELSTAGVDIHYVYGSGRVGTQFTLVLSVDDRERACEALNVCSSISK